MKLQGNSSTPRWYNRSVLTSEGHVTESVGGRLHTGVLGMGRMLLFSALLALAGTVPSSMAVNDYQLILASKFIQT
jgi:hypothetical protein